MVFKKKSKAPPSGTRLITYRALVRPTFEYANQVWDPYRKHSILQLEKVQCNAARFICSKYERTASVDQMLAENILTALSARRDVARLKLLFLFLKKPFIIPTTQYLKAHFARTVRGCHSKKLEVYTTKNDAFKN